MNPLYNLLGGGNTPFGNMSQIINQFKQFQANFQGDPRAEVEKLLQSGKMTQQQLDQLQAMAGRLKQFLG